MLDETSLKILRILQEKARISNIEVARQVEMAPSAVLERIRKMERRGSSTATRFVLIPNASTAAKSPSSRSVLAR